MVPHPADGPVPAPARAAVLTGLPSDAALRPAFEVLAAVAWRGVVPDAGVTSAHDFLRAL
jgi:hypothetical protein